MLRGKKMEILNVTTVKIPERPIIECSEMEPKFIEK
jgi:hypothetical protein